jgi:hypothetical protein
MLKVFFDWQCMMHHKFILEAAMVKEGRYMEVLSSLLDTVFLKNP